MEAYAEDFDRAGGFEEHRPRRRADEQGLGLP
jgi:hypothetical protein